MPHDFPPQEVIRRKRDGLALGPDEIAFLVEGIARGGLADAQVGALAMALFLRGLETAETAALTRAMAHSGTVLRWDDLGRPVADKHSTGGVGDKVSLMLAPIAAACGLAVPMIAGRSLGHTGGTIDKLETLPGYDVAPSLDRFRQVVRDVGCAIIGQTAELAPADRRLYAIRDITGTVESVPLITASILSKKLAAGIGALVMDVKCGSGAFMTDPDQARALAGSIATVGAAAGQRVATVITDMNQVLGRSIGNALEVRETQEYLTGTAREPRLHRLVLRLAAEMLTLTGLAADLATGTRLADRALSSGAAAEHFARMAAALGVRGDPLSPAILPQAPVVHPVLPPRTGIVQRIDVRAAGLALSPIGGCRFRPEDQVDGATGFTRVAGLNEAVGPAQPVALCHARDLASAEAAAQALLAAYTIGDGAVPAGDVVIEGLPFVPPPG